MAKAGKCPSCRGSGYLYDRARGIKFVCTNCDGHPHPADTPPMWREPIKSIIARTNDPQHSEERS